MSDEFWTEKMQKDFPKKELVNSLRLNIVGFIRIVINTKNDLEKRWNFRSTIEQADFRAMLSVSFYPEARV